MIVCAHGDVDKFCTDHDMVIGNRYSGDIKKYNGAYRILVTDADITECEYHHLKRKLLSRGVELISTRHKDWTGLSDYLAYSAGRDYDESQKRKGGRRMFGYGSDGLTEEGRRMVRRILELRDAGWTYRSISEDGGVCYPDGRKLSVSTVQIIVKNRKKYEREGL